MHTHNDHATPSELAGFAGHVGRWQLHVGWVPEMQGFKGGALSPTLDQQGEEALGLHCGSVTRGCPSAEHGPPFQARLCKSSWDPGKVPAWVNAFDKDVLYVM